MIDQKPRLTQTQSLREKVTALEREILVLSRCCQNQREELSLMSGVSRSGGPELVLMTSSLREEKEGELEMRRSERMCLIDCLVSAVEKERDRMVREVKGLQMRQESLEKEKVKAEEEKTELDQLMFYIQRRCHEKIKVQFSVIIPDSMDNVVSKIETIYTYSLTVMLFLCSQATEEKYESMVAVTHQLESQLTELRASEWLTGRTKKPSPPRRHKRSKSNPATVHCRSPAITHSHITSSRHITAASLSRTTV